MGNVQVWHTCCRVRLRVWSLTLAIVLWTAAAQAASPVRIDLTVAPWSAIQGFHESYAAGFSEQNGAVKIGGFPIWPLRIFNVPPGSGVHHFGLETSFGLSRDELSGVRSLALFLPGIGQSWALYLNGHPLRENVFAGPDRPLAARRTVRDEIVNLPHDWLIAGSNRLVLHVAGDASAAAWAQNGSLGLSHPKGYRIAEFEELLPFKDETVTIATFAVYLILGLLSLLLFSYRRREKPFLYFSIFTILIFVYFCVRSTLVFQWAADTTWLTRLEYATLAAASPFAILFVHSFLHTGKTKIPLPIRVYVLLCGTLAAANLVLPFQYNVIVLRMWQWTVFPALGYATYQVVAAARAAAAETAATSSRSDALKLAPGMAVFFVAVAWDVINSIIASHRIQLTQFGFFFFVFSIAIILAHRFLQMHEDAERLNKELIESEARLQSLFDATVEAICIHENDRIVDANPSFAKLFGIPIEDAKGKPVTDFFGPESRDVLLREFTIAKRPFEATAKSSGGGFFTAELINKTIAYDGRPLTATSIRDITGRKNAEKKLRHRNEELEELSRIMVERELRMIALKKELEKLRNT